MRYEGALLLDVFFAKLLKNPLSIFLLFFFVNKVSTYDFDLSALGISMSHHNSDFPY